LSQTAFKGIELGLRDLLAGHASLWASAVRYGPVRSELGHLRVTDLARGITLLLVGIALNRVARAALAASGVWIEQRFG
jgi:hypothetical protein